MKTLKIITVSLIFAVFMIMPVMANENNYYKEQFEASGAENLPDALPDEARELLNELGIDISDYDSLKAPDFKNIINIILDCITSGIKTPFATCLSAIGIILIFSLINTSFSTEKAYGGYNIFLALVLTALLLSPLSAIIDATAEVLKGLSVFLSVFVPVLAAILSAVGHTATAGTMATAVLGVSQFMSHFVTILLVPITKAATCLGLCGSLSSLGGISRLCTLIKNGILWCFGTASAVFLSILSMQTAVSVTADSTLVKTSKSVIAGLIPVMGPLISESLSVAGGCLNILKTGVGIYGILALALSVLPIFVSLVCWKVGILGTLAVGELFGVEEISNLLRAVDFCLSVLIGAVVFTVLIYIISVGIVLK